MTQKTRDYSLCFARVVLGAGALLHGIADTFGVWGGPMLSATTSDIAVRTSASPEWLVYVVSIGLMVAGVVLLLGTMTRAAALFMAILAIWHGLANNRFHAYFIHAQGCETLLALIALCLVVATHGPGAFKVEWGNKAKK